MQFHVDETVEAKDEWVLRHGELDVGTSYFTGIGGMMGSPRYPPSGDNRINKRADVLVHVRLIAVTIPIITMRRLQ